MRADARLNRERIVSAAQAQLQDAGSGAGAGAGTAGPLAFELVAARAGVGIGTVYRNFPTRHQLVEAVYEQELQDVCGSASELLARHSPEVALRSWMDRYAAFVSTKRGMGEALHGLISAGAVTSTGTRALLTQAVDEILEAGRSAAVFRDDVAADDVVAAMAGAMLAATGPESGAQVARLHDLIVSGLRR